MNISNFLKDAIENENHENLSLLWIDTTKSNIKCIDCESYYFYKFNSGTLLFKKLQINEFSELVKQELIIYLKEVMKINTDTRVNKLIKKIGNKGYSSDIAKTIAVKIFDDTFIKNLDSNIDVINFKNGLVDLRTGEFKPRTTDDLFSIALEFDYCQNKNDKIINEIKEDLKHICNDDNEFLEFMLGWLGYCLTGQTNEQKSLWQIGHTASNGKSTVSKIFCCAFQEYCFKFKSESLNEKYAKIHKELAECKGVRYAYIEELKQDKLDTSLYKDLVDGDMVNNEILFSTCEKINITFKLNVISNSDPNFKSDKGMMRRGILVNHTNEFYDKEDYEQCNNRKGVYVKDKWILEKYKREEYKNALFHLLLPYSISFYNNGLKIPKLFKEGFKQLCEENDKMKDFIDSKLTITGDSNDRIYKEDFKTVYNQHCKLNFSWIHILSDIKRTGLSYDCEKKTMYEGLSQKGCIIGVKFRMYDDEDMKENPLDANINTSSTVQNKKDNYYNFCEDNFYFENDETQLMVFKEWFDERMVLHAKHAEELYDMGVLLHPHHYDLEHTNKYFYTLRYD